MAERSYGRTEQQIRPVKIHRQYSKYAPGSVLIEMGDTKVLVTTTIEERTPRHVTENHGWLTAEYAMLPGATHSRSNRERLKVSGRTSEIQRLIGRSLRACIDLTKTGERTFNIDADVIQADGGTRTASITGAYVALHDAITSLMERDQIKENPIKTPIAAVSVGIIKGEVFLDLDYEEDSSADADSNLVMTAAGEVIEFQVTSEREPLTRQQLEHMIDVGHDGIQQLLTIVQASLDVDVLTVSVSS